MTEAVLFGSYELLDRIAEGGMAEVWRARSRGVAGFEKTVVIKRVLPSLMANSGFAEMLVREAKIAALLGHPNIIQIFDLGEERGAYFIAMEYVYGKDLGAVMSLGTSSAAKGGLSLPLKLWIVAEVAKALDYAHRRRDSEGRPLNIVHRDVSPQNVLLGFEGAVKVADFGIARADQQELGKGEDPKVLRGKYAYMSPEQARGEPLDRRSDLFSLGIVLWELLTSRRLFRGASSGETLELVRNADVPPLPEELGLPFTLDAILRRALARDREDRYASAGELGVDLGRLIFELGVHVDEAELAEAMGRMFPRDETANPNKLSVDLMLRAYDDATALSHPGRDLDATPEAERSPGTRAFPSSRRIRAEQRRVVLLAAQDDPRDAAIFDAVMRSLGGLPLASLGGVREAVFGHASGGERAAEHAARAALELRRRLALEQLRVAPLPVIALLSGNATVFEGEGVEPEPALHARAADIVKERWPGDIRVVDELVAGLSRGYAFSEGNPPVLEGFRARTERDALALRRRGPLSGRREEMRVLSAGLGEVASGADRAFLVVGEAGSGKSRIVAELCALASAQDVVVVRGAGDEVETERSFGALADLFEDLCGLDEEDTPAERFAKVDRLRVLGLAPHAVRLVGELLGLSYPVAPHKRAGRPRGIELMMATRRAMRALASEGPVLLVLEDLQWMDDPTRQLLPLLLRGLARARVMTVVTARPGAALPRLEAHVLSLSPLAPGGGGRLFAFGVGARAVEEELAVRILEETGGNPGWIETMAEGLAATGKVRIDDGLACVPDHVETPLSEQRSALVTAQLAQLRGEERDLARAASVFDRGVDVKTLAELHGVPADVAELPIRRLVARRLLVDAADPVGLFPYDLVYAGSGSWGGGHRDHPLPRRVRVPGALLRRAIRLAMTDGERRRLHGRAVAVLERGPRDDPMRLDELAHHAARSVDQRRAPDYLIEAAEAARRAGDQRLAASRYAEACRLIRDADDWASHDPVELALRACTLALEASDVDLAEHVLTEARNAAADDPRTAVRVAVARSRVAGRRDAWADAVQIVSEVSDAIDAVDSGAVVAEALLEWGRAEIEAGHPERAAELLDRAQTSAGDGEPALRGRALCAYAVALARAARLDDADQAVASALAVSARLGTAELRHLSLSARAEAQAARGALAEAAARYAEAGEVAAQLGAAEEAARLDALAAVTWIEAGDDTRAVAVAERAVREGKRHRVESAHLLGVAAQSALAVAASPDPTWVRKLREAVERLEALGRFGAASHAVQMLARAHEALQDPAAATRMRARAAELADAGGHRPMAERLRRMS